MRYGATFNQIGQLIPAGLHIPQSLAGFPYVPHPLQLTGHIPFNTTLGRHNPPQMAPSPTARVVLPPTRKPRAIDKQGTPRKQGR